MNTTSYIILILISVKLCNEHAYNILDGFPCLIWGAFTELGFKLLFPFKDANLS